MNRPTEREHSEPAGDPVDELLAEAGVDDPRVAAVLASAATPDRARVRRGEESALAAFRRARATTVSAPRRRALVRTILMAAAAAAVIFLLSLAAAGGRGPSTPVPDGNSKPTDTGPPEPTPAGQLPGSAPAHDSRHSSAAGPTLTRSPGRSATASVHSESDAPHGKSSTAHGKSNTAHGRSNTAHAAKTPSTPRVKPSPRAPSADHKKS